MKLQRRLGKFSAKSIKDCLLDVFSLRLGKGCGSSGQLVGCKDHEGRWCFSHLSKWGVFMGVHGIKSIVGSWAQLKMSGYGLLLNIVLVGNLHIYPPDKINNTLVYSQNTQQNSRLCQNTVYRVILIYILIQQK